MCFLWSWRRGTVAEVKLRIESLSTLQVCGKWREGCFITGLFTVAYHWTALATPSTQQHCRGINLWRTATYVTDVLARSLRLSHPVGGWGETGLIRDNLRGPRSRGLGVCKYVCVSVWGSGQRSTYSTAAGNPSYLCHAHLPCDPEKKQISPRKRSRWHCSAACVGQRQYLLADADRIFMLQFLTLWIGFSTATEYFLHLLHRFKCVTEIKLTQKCTKPKLI